MQRYFGIPTIVIFIGLQTGCRSPEASTYSPPAKQAIPPQTELVSVLEKQFIQAGLQELGGFIANLEVDLKYATTDNIMQTDMYHGLKKAYLQPEVARKLQEAQKLLQAAHPALHLLVYDAARPLSVQQWMWDNLDLPYAEKINFLSPPDKLSLHNYGAAVDLTIASHTGALDMGTAYDDPGQLSYPTLELKHLKQGVLSSEQMANRLILRSVMLQAGFTGIDSEWWHFNSCTRDYARQHYQILE